MFCMCETTGLYCENFGFGVGARARYEFAWVSTERALQCAIELYDLVYGLRRRRIEIVNSRPSTDIYGSIEA